MTGGSKQERRLAAIMFTDMVGYSALAQKNEALALELLDEHRWLLRPVFPKHDGREIEATGDAFFVEFASALEAARCAIEIQQTLHERNRAVPDNRKILLRIGLHIGDVVYMGEHVHGDGVNIAARLEPCARPGGICLSEDVARQIQNKIDYALEKLGPQKLKNIELPIEIYNVVLPWQEPYDYIPQPHPASESNPPPNNLPQQLTSFVGREQDVKQIRGLLSRSSLITLSGPGGTGKTRLALTVASNLLDEYEDGVFVVNLATITDPELVLVIIAKTLGVKEVPGQPILYQLKSHLQPKRVLLLLDNFEQVVTAAPKLAELLLACPRLKMLVTSRLVLRLTGEQEYPVEPLKLPDPKHLPGVESLSQFAAVELFIQRARSVKPDFTVTNVNAPAIAAICVHLDGLPLAIELAAARIKLLTPQGLLARLGSKFELLRGGARDLPARHQTLRQAIAWSYDLLSPEEKVLFCRLTVFVGGCTLESAEAICNAAGGLPLGVLDGMEALVDRSLLRQEDSNGEPRFVMLETIREYGLECLNDSGEAETIRHAHANFFVYLIERAEPELNGPNPATWFDMFEREHDNIRGVVQWAEESRHFDLALRVCGALWRFWVVRGHMTEWEEKVQRLFKRAPPDVAPPARAKALNAAATMVQNLGKFAAAKALLDEAISIGRGLGDKGGIATALNNLGWVAWRLGDYDETRALCSESLELHRELGDMAGMAISLTNLGFSSFLQGDFLNGTSLFDQALALRRELGDKRGIAYVQTLLGWIEERQGRYEKGQALMEGGLALFESLGDKQLSALARCLLGALMHDIGEVERASSLHNESIEMFREVGNRWAIALNFAYLGNVRMSQGNPEGAEKLFIESREIFSEIGSKWGVANVLHNYGVLLSQRGDHEKAQALLKESLQLRQTMKDRQGIADCLTELAGVLVWKKDFEKAGLLFGAAEALQKSIGSATPKFAHERYDRYRAGIINAVGEKVLGIGRNLRPEEAVDQALAL